MGAGNISASMIILHKRRDKSMRDGIKDLMDGIESFVNHKINNSGSLVLRSCQIKSYDSMTHKYTGIIDTVEYKNIVTISATQYSAGDVVKVLANNYNNAFNNITIIGKVQ